MIIPYKSEIIYRCIENDFHSGVSQIVHFLPPKHLIFDFKCFRYIHFCGKLLYQAREYILVCRSMSTLITISLQRRRYPDPSFFTPFVMISDDSFGRPPRIEPKN